MRLILSALALSSLSACGPQAVVEGDMLGSFCAQASSAAKEDYRLHLGDQRYTYTITRAGESPAFSMAGTYMIYGNGPIERVELKGICLEPDRPGACGDYPAQVLSELSGPEIILRDIRGAPLALNKCT